jgi:hypothetical protein
MSDPIRHLAENLDRHVDRFYGKYRGLVLSNQDPLKMGRVQVSVPEVLGETSSGWAMPCVPYAGTGSGFYSIPMVGAGVWVEFEAGDPSYPVWVGTWWATGEAPIDNAGALPDPLRKEWRTETGLMVTMDDGGQTIAISDVAGVNLVTIKVLEGTVEVRALAKVVLEAPLIDHGQGASHPAVFGDQLLAYLSTLVTLFNTHVHPGELAAGVLPVTPAPPVAPFTPPSPSMLSIKNLVE